MPFVFAVLGVLFLIVAINGTQATLWSLLKSEFVGTNSFIPWASAIIILGLIGYAKPVKPIADGLIGLILLALILANKGGFFAQFNNALRNPVAPATPGNSPATAGVSPTQDPNAPTGVTRNMPSYSDYFKSLPSSDQSWLGGLGSLITGNYSSGLPTYGTLNGLNEQALFNDQSGAAGL